MLSISWFNPSCALWLCPSSVPIKLIPSLSPPLTPSLSSYQEMSIWLSDLWPGRTEVRAGCHNLRRWEKKTTSDIWENWGCIFLTQYVYGCWVTWSFPPSIRTFICLDHSLGWVWRLPCPEYAEQWGGMEMYWGQELTRLGHTMDCLWRYRTTRRTFDIRDSLSHPGNVDVD